jgi:hypothetical protein
MKDDVIFVGSYSAELLRNFLADLLLEGCIARQKTVDEPCLPDVDDPNIGAILCSQSLALREQRRCPKARLILAFETFAKFDATGTSAPETIVDPKSQRELVHLFKTIAGANYILCYAVTAIFPGVSDSELVSTSKVIETEISIAEPPESWYISEAEFRESGPNRPFHGYFRKCLSDPEGDLSFLSCKVYTWIRGQCFARGLKNVFPQKRCR